MKYIVIIIAVIMLCSCEKLMFDKEPASTPVENFNFMCNVIQNKYALFEYKQINWDLIRKKYQPLIKENMGDDELFTVLSAMLAELKDGHANLQSAFNRSRNWDWFLDFPQNFNRTIQQRNYLGKNYMVTGAIEHQLIDSVAYLYIPSFEIHIHDEDLDYIFNRYQNAKGMIIDIRNNGGGSAKGIFKVASRIVDKKIHVYSSWFKNGPAPDDFGKEIKVYAEPEGKPIFGKKVIVLTNRACYSAANRFAAVFSLLPNVTLIGDKTGGGGGTPCYVELPNGWSLRFSAMKTLLPDGYNIDNGIEPDIKVNITTDDEAKGKDPIIERALAEI